MGYLGCLFCNPDDSFLLGKTFQIWEPKNFEKFKIFARKKAFQNRSNLKWENKQKGDCDEH